MDAAKTTRLVDTTWDATIVPTLVDYIRIPNKSPAFDAQWQEHGFMEQAVKLLEGWCREQAIDGLTLETVRLPGRTPLLYLEIPGEGPDTVLLYGHYDKQPEMTGWDQGLGPWEPVMRGERLYGRGGADDGYAVFASLTAIRALRDQRLPHARCVVLIEGCEESGSYDLPAYIDHLKARIGEPSLVVCLDSGAGNYDQLWCTTSLRGLVGVELTVEILREGVHSGDASGIVPSSFRILRQLLGRIEDAATGRVLPAELWVDVPRERLEQAKASAEVLGASVYERFPWAGGARPAVSDPLEAILARTWRPALSITGADGLPALGSAGNVLRPKTSLKLSMRLPPTCDPEPARRRLVEILTANPPYGAKVTCKADQASSGWNAPAAAPWLVAAIDQASRTFFGWPAAHMGEGGTIPFMGMLGKSFPKAQFLITGVLGPQANAHGPNEFLHVPYGKRITASVAAVLAEHRRRSP